MDYVINPAWFYLFHVVDGVRGAAIASAALSICTIIVGAIVFFAEYMPSDEEKNTAIKWGKRIAIVAVLSTIISVFVPSKQVMMQMMVANYATHENINLTIDTIKELVDYVAQVVAK